MKIAFAGAGAVGCHYGSKLQQAGFEVLLLARGQHLQALQSHGLKHESEGEVNTIKLFATDDVAALSACDIIILSCKMTGLEAMLAALQHHIKADALLLTLQNGVEAPDLVAQAFPQHAIAAATAFIGARLHKPGYVIHSAAGAVRLGLWQQGNGAHFLSDLIKAFEIAAVPIRLDADPASMLWRKLLWNCGFNAITAITRRYARDMAANQQTLSIVRQAMQEVVAVAKAKGIDIGAEDIDKHIAVTLSMGPVKTSMWQDIEAGQTTEVDHINGYIVEQAKALQLSASVNQVLTSLIQIMQQK